LLAYVQNFQWAGRNSKREDKNGGDNPIAIIGEDSKTPRTTNGQQNETMKKNNEPTRRKL
jgi:hypothetical protein